jgi:hypothetical protein
MRAQWSILSLQNDFNYPRCVIADFQGNPLYNQEFSWASDHVLKCGSTPAFTEKVNISLKPFTFPTLASSGTRITFQRRQNGIKAIRTLHPTLDDTLCHCRHSQFPMTTPRMGDDLIDRQLDFFTLRFTEMARFGLVHSRLHQRWSHSILLPRKIWIWPSHA